MTNEIKQRIEQINRGEVPRGYKKTAVGIVPQEWETNDTFGDLFDFYGGLGIPRDQLGENGVPYLHYGDMHREYFTRASYEKYNQLPKYDITLKGDETYLLNDGDMVFLDASEDLSGTSRCIVIDNPENSPFISGLHTFVAKPKKLTLYKEYKQYLTAPQMVKKQFQQLASGFKVYGINRNTIKKISFAYPKDIAEQQRIADILSKWDEAVSLQEKLIEKLELEKSYIISNALSQPKVGEDSLSKLVEFFDLRTNVSNQYPILSSTHNGIVLQNEYFSKQTASENNIGYKVVPFNYFTYRAMSDTDTFQFNIQDIVEFGIVSPVYPVFKAININKTYLYLYMNYSIEMKKFILQNKEGSTRYALPESRLSNLIVSYPDKAIQNKIENAYRSIQIYIKLQKQKLEKLKQQQKAMQQLLLTGIVRV